MKKRDNNGIISKIICRVILVTYTVGVVYPLFWSLLSSYKTSREFLMDPFMLPGQLYWENYVKAFIKARIGSYFFNSVIITAVVLFLSLIISFTTAYVITRYDCLYTRMLKKIYLSSFMIPAILGLAPLFLLMNRMNLIDNRAGLTIIYIVSSIPFSVYVISGFLSNISLDYEEAAFIDGCSRYGIMFKVIFPISLPSLVTVTIFNFLGVWNEYIYAVTLIQSEEKMTLPTGLVYLMEVQRYATDWGALFAGMVIAMLPSLVFYALLQRKITSGLTAGGIKM